MMEMTAQDRLGPILNAHERWCSCACTDDRCQRGRKLGTSQTTGKMASNQNRCPKSAPTFNFRRFLSSNTVLILCLVLSLLQGALGQTNTDNLSPSITSNSITEFISDSDYTLLCQITVASSLTPDSPFPLTWVRTSSPLPADVVINNGTQEIRSNIRYETRLTIRPRANDNKRVIQCHAKFGVFTGFTEFTPLVILVPTDPVVSGPRQVKAGDVHTWTCLSDGASISKPNVYFRDPNGNSLASENTRATTEVSRVPNENTVYKVLYNITFALPSTSATYKLTCYAVHTINNYETVGRTDYFITVQFAPRVTKVGANDVRATEFTELTLSCVVNANPDANSISWTKNGESIDTSLSKYGGVTLASPSLVINPVEQSDTGDYTCSASNTEGTGIFATPTSLVVRYTPVISYVDTTFNGGLGGSVTLQCPVNSEPLPTTIRWKQDLDGIITTIRIDLDVRFTGGDPVTQNYGLTINPLQVADGDKKYFCEADNNVGTGRGSLLTLVVNERPVIQPSVSDVSATENGQFTLPCDVTPLDSLTDVYWTQNGQRLTTSTDPTKYIGGTTFNPRLTVFRATDSDIGVYQCVVSNPYGTTLGTSITMTLKFSPRLVVTDDPVTPQIGGSVFLSCTVSANPPVTSLYWTKNGATISSLSSPSKYSGGNIDIPSLIIYSATILDDGQYNCVAVNEVGVTFSKAVSVTVTGTPLVTVTPADATVEEGVSFYTFACEIIANPAVTEVYWLHNGNRVSSSNDQGSKYIGGTTATPNLTIRSVSRQDAGEYQCVALNQQGTGLSRASQMNVIYKPTVTTSESDLTRQVGTSVTIPCSVSANPAMTGLSWLRNGLTLVTTNLNKYSGGTVSRPSLTIFNLQAQEDTGVYACVATNSRGTTTSPSVQLTVTSEPVITPVTDPVQAVENQDFVVPCEVTPLDSIISVSWRKDGVTLNTSDASKYNGGTSATPSLTVLAATDSDVGRYRCVPSNDVGTTVGDAVVVVLIYRPRVTVPSQAVTGQVGDTVLLTCSVDANPKEDEVYWTLDGAGKLSSTTDPAKYSGGNVDVPSLIIVSAVLQDTGSYRCVASNSVGQGTSPALAVSIDGNPLVTVGPADPVVDEGHQNLVLTCTFVANPSATDLYWAKDGIEIIDDPSKYSGGTLDTPNLTILSVKASDKGDYRCLVTNPEGVGLQSPLTLRVRHRPIVTVKETPINANAGSDVTLTCVVDAYPNTTDVRWVKQGLGQIDSTSSPSKYADGDVTKPSLVILKSEVQDTGTYTCIAENEMGITNSSDVTVNINGIPVVTAAPRSYTVDETDQVTLSCSYTSVPSATDVYWIKDVTILDVPGQSALYQGSTLSTPSLTILEVKPTDLGAYTCYVVNSEGTGSSRTVSLNVRYGPIVTTSSDPINRPIGSRVTLTCNVDANPEPTSVHWVKSGQGQITADDVTYSGGNASSPNLVILNSVTSDTGDYRCVVNNDMGMSTSKPVTVSIIGIPRVTASGPSSHVLEGSSVTLTCSYESVPAAEEVYWTKDVGQLDVAGQSEKYNGSTLANPSLTIANLEASDNGVYMCFVTNDVDTGFSDTVTLDVWYVPILTVNSDPITNGPGNPVVISCDVQSNPDPTEVYWTKDGQGQLNGDIDSAKYAFGNVDQPSLVIRGSQMSDTGSYRCVVTNSVGTRTSEPVSVSITSIPVVAAGSSTITEEEGTPQTVLTCSFEAVPAATKVYWTKDGTELDVAGQSSKFSGSTVDVPHLTVSNVVKSDAGSYVCFVVNSLGSGFSDATVLDVTYAPSLTVPTETINRSPGSLLTLTCRVDANPEITSLHWVKAGKGQISSVAEPGRYVGGDLNANSLGILSPQTADSGTYTCLANNSVGTTTSTPVNVNIISIPTVTATAPANSVDEGQSVTLNCTYLAVPNALLVFWTKGGAQVDVVGQPGKYSGATVDTPSLTILTVGSSDQGSYVCNVNNDIGTGSSGAIQVDVNYKPILTVPSDQLAQRPGNTLLLLCTVDSVPDATDVYWTKTGPGRIVPASNPSKYKGGDTGNSNLQILSTTSDDTGSYFCVAVNRLGTTTSSEVEVSIINVPSVTASTTNATVASGSTNVVLACTYQATPTATDLYWTKDGTLIQAATEPTLLSGGTFASSDLVLLKVDRDSAGQYVCNVKNSEGVGASNAITLDVTFLPIITVPSTPVTGSPGGTVTLPAQVEANPEPTEVYWTKAGQGRIDSNANPTKYSGGNRLQNSLTILSNSLSDTGTYQLVVVNAMGETTSTAVSVSIENVPVVVVSPRKPVVSESTANVIFTCSYQANPEPTEVYWTKNGQTLATGDRIVGGDLDIPNLTIKSVLKEDAGTYECNVRNSVGLGTSPDIVLDVLYQPLLTVSDVSIRTSPGTTVRLTCRVDANPTSDRVYWSRSGQGPISSAVSPSKYVGGNSTVPDLQILDVQIDDSGNYFCSAANSQGLTSSAVVAVDIVNIPTVTAASSASSVDEGAQNILFTCNFQANPSATELYWTQDGTRIDSTASRDKYTGGSLAQSRLTIREVDRADRGSFVCNVKNSIGTGSSSAVRFDVTFPPTLVTSNTTVIGAKGSTATLTCDVQANPVVTSFRWTKDGTDINLSQPPDKYSGGTLAKTDLTILDLDQNSDVASYVCIATNDKGTTRSSPVQLRVTFDPVVTAPASVSGKEGQALTIACTVQMFPPATSITWYKDNAALDVVGNSGRYSGGTTATPALTIISASKEDVGQYRCEATNGQTPVSSGNSAVTLTYPPKITTSTPPEGTVGAQVVLQCNVDANPLPTVVQWTFVGSSGSSVTIDVNQVRYSGGTTTLPSLTISSVQVSDAGVYRCSVTNAEGTVSSPAIDFKVRYGPRNVDVTADKLTLNSNQSYTLTCTSDAYPAPTYEWTRNGLAFGTSSSFTRVATSLDNGQFQCTVINELGSDSATLNLNVRYTPETSVTGPQNIRSALGTNVTLTCDVTANPSPPTYAWFKKSSRLDGQTSRTLVLTNLAPGDFDTYTCAATNSIGTTNPAITFVLIEGNAAPSNLQVSAVPLPVTAGLSFTLRCQADGSPQPRFSWSRGNTVVSQSATYTRTAEPSDNTQFTCTAVNDEGQATRSLTMDVQYRPVANKNGVSVVTGPAGAIVTLTCDVSANPAVTSYAWFRGANNLQNQGETISVTVDTAQEYTCAATNNLGTLNPAGSFRIEPASVGASTNEDSGLSTTTIILIVVILIIILIILILVFIFCLQGKCSRKKEKSRVSPAAAVVAKPFVGYSNGTGPFGPTVTSSDKEKLKIEEDEEPRYLTPSLHGGPIISLPEKQGPRAHHLPPLSSGAPTVENYYREEKRRSRKKKRRRRMEDASNLTAEDNSEATNITYISVNDGNPYEEVV